MIEAFRIVIILVAYAKTVIGLGLAHQKFQSTKDNGICNIVYTIWYMVYKRCQ